MWPINISPARVPIPVIPQVIWIQAPEPTEERPGPKYLPIRPTTSPIMMAIEGGDNDIIEHLLSKEIKLDPNHQFPQTHRYFGMSMAQVAILLSSWKLLERLVRQKADFDPNARFPNNHAFYADMTPVQVVVDHSMINDRKRLIYHSLQQLAYAPVGREEAPAILAYLVWCGADLNRPFPKSHPEYSDMNLVHIAILTRRFELLDYLKKHGANIQIPFPKFKKSYSEMTPLQAAIMQKDLRMVKILDI